MDDNDDYDIETRPTYEQIQINSALDTFAEINLKKTAGQLIEDIFPLSVQPMF